MGTGGSQSRTHTQHHADLGAAVSAIEANVPLLNHNHTGTGTRATNKLLQSSTHETPDTDTASSSLHHTIGPGSSQAASGSHLHAGAYMPVEAATGNRYYSNTVQQYYTNGTDTINYYPIATRSSTFITPSTSGAGSTFTLNRTGVWAITAGMRYNVLPGDGGEVYLGISNNLGLQVAQGGPAANQSNTRSVSITDYFTNGSIFWSNTFIYAFNPGPIITSATNPGWTFMSLVWLRD